MFWKGLFDGSAPAGQYENWATGEPNEFFGGVTFPEDFLHMWSFGEWNDINTEALFGYFVEIGV